MSVVVVDDEHRVLMTREVKERAGISKGDGLLVIPFSGYVLPVALKGEHFAGYLKDFAYDEEAHEASRHLLGRGQ